MKWTLSLAAMAGVAILASPVLAAEPAGARTFLTKLYAHYPYRAGRPAFDALGRQAPQVFDPTLIALVRENERLTPKDEVGALNGDPICDCQDSEGMSARIGTIRTMGRSTAMARVDITFAVATPPDTRQLDLDLVQSRGQWRIRDIHSKDQPSLRAYLLHANREAAAAAKKK